MPRPNPARCLLLVILGACAAPLACVTGDRPVIQEGSIRVEARLRGRSAGSGSATTRELALAHPEPAPESAPSTRLVQLDDPALRRLEELELEVTSSTGLPFDESFVFLAFARDAPGWPEIDGEVTDAPGWRRRHTGGLGILRVRKDDISLPSVSFDSFKASPFRPAGAAWLARLEDDDRRLPWRKTPGPDGATDDTFVVVPRAQSLFVPPAGDAPDYFDLETLTGMLLANLAWRFSEAIFLSQGPVALSLSDHAMHVIPHLPSSGGVTGFGLMYSCRLDGHTLGAHVLQARIHVPLTFSFQLQASAGASGYQITVDPLGPGPWTNTDRVTLVPELITTLPAILAMVRDEILAGLGQVELPSVPVGSAGGEPLEVDLTVALNGLFEQVLGPAPDIALNDHAVVAVPTKYSTVTSLSSAKVLSIADVEVSEVNLPPTGGEDNDLEGVVTVTSLPGGVTRVQTFLDEEGKTARRCMIQPPSAHQTFDLWFLE